MKSVTLAVIIAGLTSYGTIYLSPAVPSHESSYSTLALEPTPFPSDPDDEEDQDRVSTHKKPNKENP